MSANVSRTSIGFEGASQPASARLSYPSSSAPFGSAGISEAQRSFAQPTQAPHAKPPKNTQKEQGFMDWFLDAFRTKKA